LLVEGIRPILPLIRNTPYGKRIQNKLQREHMDHFGGGYQGVVNHLGGPHGRHMPQPHLTEVYSGQNPLYSIPSQASFAQGSPLHGMPSTIDSYVLQGNAGHSPAGISPSHSHGANFSNAAFANIGSFAGAGIPGSMNDPYQRGSFGYGM
jgi:hypothetical protein